MSDKKIDDACDEALNGAEQLERRAALAKMAQAAAAAGVGIAAILGSRRASAQGAGSGPT